MTLPALTLTEAAPLLAPYLVAGEGAPKGVILAVSGGPDSVALMRFCAAIRPQRDAVPLVVATIDHGLRPGSRAEADTVAGWAGEAGLPHRILAWEGPKPRTRLQEAAREARYRLLASDARERGFSHVLTAHTLDDQAETVLMRLAAGTGVAGLAGMRRETERDGIVITRPLLGLRKARLLAANHAEGWPFLDDSSNADPRFARARLRLAGPHLAALGLTPERLGALAARAARAADALEARIGAVFDAVCLGHVPLTLDAAALWEEPEAIRLGVVAHAIARACSCAKPPRLERLEARILGDLGRAIETGRRLRLTLGGALLALAPDGRLLVVPEPPRRRGRGTAVIMPHSLGNDLGET